MRAPRLLRTAAFRLAALYGLLFAGSVMILMAVTFTLVERAVTAQIEGTVRMDAEVLAGDIASGRGESAVARAGTIHRFARAADGTVILGDIVPRIPRIGPFQLSASDLQADAGQEDDDTGYIAYGIRLPGGGYVLAAQDDE